MLRVEQEYERVFENGSRRTAWCRWLDSNSPKVKQATNVDSPIVSPCNDMSIKGIRRKATYWTFAVRHTQPRSIRRARPHLIAFPPLSGLHVVHVDDSRRCTCEPVVAAGRDSYGLHITYTQQAQQLKSRRMRCHTHLYRTSWDFLCILFAFVCRWACFV